MIQNNRTEITTWTIIKLVLVLLGFYLIYTVRDIIALFAIVLILVATFSSTVEKWSKKITRPGAVAAVLLIILGVIGLLVYIIIPPLVTQTIQLVQNLPEYLNRIGAVKDHLPQIKTALASLSSEIGGISNSVISFTTGLFGGIVAIIMVLVLFVYLLLDEHGIKNSFLSFFPEQKREQANNLFRKVANKAGNWLRGQILLAFLIGAMHAVVLIALGVPYAVTLVVMSAALEFIPTIGPIISGIIAVAISLSVSPVKAVIVLIWYLIVQQLETTYFGPKIMGKAVGLSPVIIIFAILIGAKLYGMLGVVLSVPIAASIMVIVQEWQVVKNLIKSDE